MTRPDLAEVEPDGRTAWRRWLEDNHASAAGVWLVSHRRSTGRQRITLDEAVEEAVCFGWIDSRLRPIDGDRSALLFTPRRRGSPWSRSNKQRVEALTRLGRMAGAGIAVVEAAQRDGSWTVLDDVEALHVPDDLQAALDADPAASANFASFTPSARKAGLGWIATAKRPRTRAARIAEVVRLAALNRPAGR